jgi:hypothetical protein
MSFLNNYLAARKIYLKNKRVLKLACVEANTDYQIAQLVKQCSDAKHAQRNALKLLLSAPLQVCACLASFVGLPYLTLLGF